MDSKKFTKLSEAIAFSVRNHPDEYRVAKALGQLATI